jgi:hypothetical protein
LPVQWRILSKLKLLLFLTTLSTRRSQAVTVLSFVLRFTRWLKGGTFRNEPATAADLE